MKNIRKIKQFIVLSLVITILSGNFLVANGAAGTDYSENTAKSSAKPHSSVSYGTEEPLPASYDSRNVTVGGGSIITPVKQQESFGTCWAFSASSAAETSLIKKGLMSPNNSLSPLHMAYFVFHNPKHPSNLSGDDKVYLSESNFLDSGGNEHLSVFSMANWTGSVSENVVPYNNAFQVYNSGLHSDYAYAKDIGHLENAYWLFLNDTENVKRYIMEHGSGSLSYYFDIAYQSNGNYYCDISRYDEDGFSTNHQVTVVGWDDNYSRNNFTHNVSNVPKGDGAWLVKNSWGDYEDGNEGYFWLSYYDGSIYAEDQNNTYAGDIVFFDMNSADNYDNNYYYDGSSNISWMYFYDPDTMENYDTMEVANIFQSEQDEKLEAVSVFALQDQTQYTVSVYKNLTADSKPTDGVLAAQTSGIMPYYGYHTITLPDEVNLYTGDRFSVVVQLSVDESLDGVRLAADLDGSWPWGVEFRAFAKQGESFFREPGLGWEDAYVERDKWDDEYVNYRIKAFTTNRNPEVTGDINYDGEIDALDALSMLKLVAGMNVKTYKQGLVGDVNRDTTIDALDALQVLKLVAGMIEEF